MVVHFQGKVFNPKWKITGHFLTYKIVDVEEGPTDKRTWEELNEEMGKNYVHARKHISQGDFPATRLARL
jgi:hypothetical protein